MKIKIWDTEEERWIEDKEWYNKQIDGVKLGGKGRRERENMVNYAFQVMINKNITDFKLEHILKYKSFKKIF